MKSSPPASLIHLKQHPLICNYFPSHYQKELQLRHYKSGDWLYQQGEQLDVLTYFLHGKLKVLRRLFNGKEHILGIYDQPMIIGGIELLTNKPLVSSVIILEDSWLVQLPLKHSRNKLLQDPDFLYKIGQTLAHSLYQQNIRTATNIGYTVKERLASHILSLGQDQFQLELTLLADSFGTSYRHLLRTIQNLTQEGILTKQGRTYEIAKRKKLEVLAIKDS